MDPHFRELNIKKPGEMKHVKNMIKFFVPKPSETKTRRDLLQEYQFFKTGTGPYLSIFGADESDEDEKNLNLDYRISEENTMKTINIKDVSDWVKRTGGHNSKLAWFCAWKPNSLLYQKVAKRLLSLRSTGSMSVERIAKPMKNFVYSKSRRRMDLKRSSMLLRVGLNLRFLAQTKLNML